MALSVITSDVELLMLTICAPSGKTFVLDKQIREQEMSDVICSKLLLSPVEGSPVQTSCDGSITNETTNLKAELLG